MDGFYEGTFRKSIHKTNHSITLKLNSMKTIFTFIISMFTMLSVLAQNQNLSRITISSMTNNPIRVVFDGRQVNDRYNQSNSIYLPDIRQGNHTVKIYVYKSRGRWQGASTQQMQLIYDGRIFVKARHHIDIVVNRFGRAFVDETPISGNWYFGDDDWDNNNWNNNPWNNHPGNNNNPWNNNPGNNNQWNNFQPMDAVSFNQFKQTVENASFNNTKLAVAKQTIDVNYFTAQQVKELVELFSFETSRLEIAKYCFKRCTEQNNYFIVSNALNYSSSREELMKYMQDNR